MKSIDKLGISPFPWRARDLDLRAERIFIVEHKGYFPIVGVYRQDRTLYKNNARLIAAAPELYQALVGCVSVLEDIARDEGWDLDEITIAKKALAKAAGEEVAK